MNPRILGFIGRSLRSSLRSEALAHLLTLTIICACLGLVAAVQLAQRNLIDWAEQWADDQAVLIYIDPAASPEVRQGIERGARRADLVDLRWRSPRESAADLAAVTGLADEQTLADYAPWILRGLRSPGSTTAEVLAIGELKGVLHLDEGTVVAKRSREIARTIRSFGAVLALLVLTGGFLVVSNTVGLALNARRDEVEIMSLIGTPLGWIYAAYLTEGVLLGAIGAGLAALLVELPLRFGVGDVLTGFGLPPLAGLAGAEVALLMLLGGLVGAAGSSLAIRRFLRPPSEA